MEAHEYDKKFRPRRQNSFDHRRGRWDRPSNRQTVLRQGANLVLVDLDPETEQIGYALGSDAARFSVRVGDVTQSSHRERTVASSLEGFGSVDILINNAGLSRLAPALELTGSQWDATLDLNLRAVFFLSQRIGAEMIKRGGGRIVNLASQAGVVAGSACGLRCEQACVDQHDPKG